jgi:phosphoglycolate phosphatase
MDKIEAIIFDLDGTLWNAVDGICWCWNQVLQKHPQSRSNAKSIELSKEELSGYLGLPMTEIANRMCPGISDEEKQRILEECCKVENDYLNEHGGILYPELEKTLLELKKDYKLFVVSNCQKGYIESFINAHKLSAYFDDIECWGNNLLPKGENNKLIMKRNNVTRAVYVGDTAGDEESARVAGILFIFAKYGFGQAKAPDFVLEEFSKLPALMDRIREGK